MKKLLAVFIFQALAACLFAQGLVTIQAIPGITRADGTLANGTVAISWQAFQTADGTPVAAGTKNVTIASGSFATTVQLYPNVGATPPGTSYFVQYNLSGSPVFQRRWYVPASSIPVTVVSIEFPPPGLVGQTAIVSPAQLTQAGATVNQSMCWNGAMWGPGSCGGGSFSLPGPVGSLLYKVSSSSFGAVGLGTSTTVLHGNASGAPVYGQITGGDIASGAVSLTSQVSGVLPPANGGTGTSTQFSTGSIVFVGSGGIYQQDVGSFCWDSANHRLGILTCAPVAQLDIRESSGTGIGLSISSSAGTNSVFRMIDGNATNTWSLVASISGQLNFNNTTGGVTALTLSPASSDVVVGGTVDNSIRLDIVNSGSAGTFRAWDQSGAGTTQAFFKSGVAQGSTPVLQVQDASGVTQASFLGGILSLRSERFNGTTSGAVSIQPAAVAGNWTLTLPTTAGGVGQFLQTDGFGVTTWATGGGGGGGTAPYTLCASGCDATVPSSGTTIPSATHRQGAGAVLACFDANNPHNWSTVGSANSAASPLVVGDVTLTYAIAPTYCMIYTLGGAGTQGATGLGATIGITNAGSTGTTVNKLAKLTGAPSTVVIAGTTDTGGIIGIVTAGAGTAGTATIQTLGAVTCVFDAATTAGHYVQISPTVAGDCHDAGSSYPSIGQVIGRVLSTNGSGGSYGIDIFPSEIQAGGTGNVTVVGAGNLTSTAIVTGGGTQTLQTAAPTATMDSSGNVSTPGTVSAGVGSGSPGRIAMTPGTVSQLPTCNGGAEGSLQAVTDSTTATWGATIAGSGSNHVLAYCDGSLWTVAAK